MKKRSRALTPIQFLERRVSTEMLNSRTPTGISPSDFGWIEKYLDVIFWSDLASMTAIPSNFTFHMEKRNPVSSSRSA